MALTRDAYVRVLSLKQPWTWMVLHEDKNIENRVWNTSYRGPFLIHASAGMTHTYYAEAVRTAAELLGTTTFAVAFWLPNMDRLPRGGIVGRACLVDVLHKRAAPTTKWHMPNQYGYVLEAIEPTAFMPLRGFQRFFYTGVAAVEDAIPGTRTWLEKHRAA